MDIETRLTKLENLVHAFIKSAGIKADYANADTNAIRVTEGEHGEQINLDSESIFDLADLAGENSDANFDLAEMVSDLEARVTELENK